MMMDINKLPAEMLLEVHQRLTKSALTKAVLVSKLWRDVGQDPALWEWCKVAVYTKEDISNLSIKRLQRIQEIYINPDTWDANDWEAFFRAANEFSCLKKIDGLDRGTNWGPSGLDSVEPDMLARSLAKLEDVNVYGCTYEQIEVLFEEMSRSTRVKNFHLRIHDLSQMEPGLFARVLSKLENVRLFGGNVTPDQMEAFFIEIMNKKSLKKLDLLDENIWIYLEPGLFAMALATVEDVSLTDYKDINGVSSDHLEALFSELSDRSDETQLKRLCLNGCDLSEIEPTLLASALSSLEELCLNRNFISTVQIRTLFSQISRRNQMKKLVLLGNDLWQLNSELFARVMARLEDVELDVGDYNIAKNKMPAFFTEMSRNSHLKSLKIDCGDLRYVGPEVLAKALTRLETLALTRTRIANDQLESLFSEMSRNTVMKKIDLSGNDLTSVEPELFVRALMRLEEVILCGSGITHEQAKAFFTEMSQNSHRIHLKKLNLGVDDFSAGRGDFTADPRIAADRRDFTAVDPEVLATAVTNVKEVFLRNSILSTEQITSIFALVLDGEKKLKKLNIGGSGRAAAHVNPEIVRKVKEKLKYELF